MNMWLSSTRRRGGWPPSCPRCSGPLSIISAPPQEVLEAPGDDVKEVLILGYFSRDFIYNLSGSLNCYRFRLLMSGRRKTCEHEK